MRPEAGFDAVVLAGGRSTRMGGVDKCDELVGQLSLLERALDAVGTAQRVVVVGPARPTMRSVVWTQEEPVGGGPIAALVAALDQLSGSDVVVVVAGDLPFARTAVPRLLVAVQSGGADGAVLVDPHGREQWLLAAYRTTALRAALGHGPSADRSMRSVTEQLRLLPVRAEGAEAMDCDTPDELRYARVIAQR